MLKISLVVLFVLLVSGCANHPSKEEIAAADYGDYPFNAESVIKSYYDETLKDPSSVMYRGFSTPEKYMLGDVFSGPKYGYLVCASVNAKNSYGAYVGYKSEGFLIKNGKIVLVADNGMWIGNVVCK